VSLVDNAPRQPPAGLPRPATNCSTLLAGSPQPKRAQCSPIAPASSCQIAAAICSLDSAPRAPTTRANPSGSSCKRTNTKPSRQSANHDSSSGNRKTSGSPSSTNPTPVGSACENTTPARETAPPAPTWSSASKLTAGNRRRPGAPGRSDTSRGLESSVPES